MKGFVLIVVLFISLVLSEASKPTSEEDGGGGSWWDSIRAVLPNFASDGGIVEPAVAKSPEQLLEEIAAQLPPVLLHGSWELVDGPPEIVDSHFNAMPHDASGYTDESHRPSAGIFPLRFKYRLSKDTIEVIPGGEMYLKESALKTVSCTVVRNNGQDVAVGADGEPFGFSAHYDTLLPEGSIRVDGSWASINIHMLGNASTFALLKKLHKGQTVRCGPFVPVDFRGPLSKDEDGNPQPRGLVRLEHEYIEFNIKQSEGPSLLTAQTRFGALMKSLTTRAGRSVDNADEKQQLRQALTGRRFSADDVGKKQEEVLVSDYSERDLRKEGLHFEFKLVNDVWNMENKTQVQEWIIRQLVCTPLPCLTNWGLAMEEKGSSVQSTDLLRPSDVGVEGAVVVINVPPGELVRRHFHIYSKTEQQAIEKRLRSIIGSEEKENGDGDLGKVADEVPTKVGFDVETGNPLELADRHPSGHPDLLPLCLTQPKEVGVVPLTVEKAKKLLSQLTTSDAKGRYIIRLTAPEGRDVFTTTKAPTAKKAFNPHTTVLFSAQGKGTRIVLEPHTLPSPAVFFYHHDPVKDDYIELPPGQPMRLPEHCFQKGRKDASCPDQIMLGIRPLPLEVSVRDTKKEGRPITYKFRRGISVELQKEVVLRASTTAGDVEEIAASVVLPPTKARDCPSKPLHKAYGQSNLLGEASATRTLAGTEDTILGLSLAHLLDKFDAKTEFDVGHNATRDRLVLELPPILVDAYDIGEHMLSVEIVPSPGSVSVKVTNEADDVAVSKEEIYALPLDSDRHCFTIELAGESFITLNDLPNAAGVGLEAWFGTESGKLGCFVGAPTLLPTDQDTADSAAASASLCVTLDLPKCHKILSKDQPLLLPLTVPGAYTCSGLDASSAGGVIMLQG